MVSASRAHARVGREIGPLVPALAAPIDGGISGPRNDQRIKSFRVARRRESSVGLTRGRGAAGYGIFKRDERARCVSVTRGRGEAGAGAGLWCGKGRKSGVGEGWGDGKEISRGKAKQTRVVACGACGVDRQGGDGRRSGSRSHGVSGGESANKEEMTDLTTRAGWWLR
jgi:hypothetical protein